MLQDYGYGHAFCSLASTGIYRALHQYWPVELNRVDKVFIASLSLWTGKKLDSTGKAQFLSFFDILNSSDSVELSWVCRYEHAKNSTQLNSTGV